jgi:hypothetical protein
MLNKLDITKNWLPRYTGMPLDRFGDYVLLTNFHTSGSAVMFTVKTAPCRRPPTVTG